MNVTLLQEISKHIGDEPIPAPRFPPEFDEFQRDEDYGDCRPEIEVYRGKL